MLTNKLLEDLFIRLDLPLKGRKIIEAIRSSEPSRRVGGGTHNVVCRFASEKMGVTIQAESHKCALPFCYVWEHDPNTLEFYDEPPQIKISYLTANGRRATHPYTPDYFLIQAAWIGWIECKTEEWLLTYEATGGERYKRDENDIWRCPPGEAFAIQYGLQFQVKSTREINWALVRNLEFLSEYYLASCPEPSKEGTCIIGVAFAGERWMTLNDLLGLDGVEADVVYALVAKNVLFVDLNDELLSEPQYTIVCRDKLSFDIYLNQKRSRVSIPSLQLHAIEMAPGTKFLWDGKPWRILNVGMSEIFVEDGKRDVCNLSFDIFHKLIGGRAIVGLDSEASEQNLQAEQIVKRASPVDLELANRRTKALMHCREGMLEAAIPGRTLRDWKAKALQGEVVYGNSFAGVIPRISARGNRDRKISQAAIDVMDQVITEQVFAGTQANILACYGFVINICDERALVCPSEKTFRNEIAKRREHQKILAREGRKAAYKVEEFYWVLDQSTPRHGERPFQIGHIDHTELDLEFVDSRSGANLGRVWLTLLIDAFTRLILATFITFDPPSYRSCMAVIREAIRRHGRIPSTIILDQGSDFESVYTESMLARLMSHKKSRPAAKSRFGSVIERHFGVTNQQLIHNLRGNSQSLQSPRSMSPSHDPRKLAVWTLPAFANLFEQYVDVHYADQRHAALGISPREAMAHGLALSGQRIHLLIPFTADFNFICMPSTPAGKAYLRAGRGVKIKGIFYWNPVLRDLPARSNLPVRYDPFDVSRAYVLVHGEWHLCRSDYANTLERRTEREIYLLSQEIRVLHRQFTSHRKDKAGSIASLLNVAQQTEAVLLQQRRDAERIESELDRRPVESAPIETFEFNAVQQEDLWGTPIKIVENFGELQ